VTHSQLFEGLKCESQIENNGRVRKGHTPWLATLWKGRGACWSSGMGLGRVDKLHSLTRTCTKPTQGG